MNKFSVFKDSLTEIVDVPIPSLSPGSLLIKTSKTLIPLNREDVIRFWKSWMV